MKRKKKDVAQESIYAIDEHAMLRMLPTSIIRNYCYEGKMPIRKVDFELTQIPAQHNGNNAVVTATVTTDAGSFQGIGTGYIYNKNKNLDFQAKIDAAIADSFGCALSLAYDVNAHQEYLQSMATENSFTTSAYTVSREIDQDSEKNVALPSDTE